MRGFILLISILIITGSKPVEIHPEQILQQTLLEVGAMPERLVLHHGGRTKHRLTVGQTETLAQQMGSIFSFPLRQGRQTKDGIRYSMKGRIGSGIHAAIHILYDGSQQMPTRPYITIQVMGAGDMTERLQQIRSQLQAHLQDYGVIPHFQYSIQGSQPVTNQSSKPTVQEALQRLHAEEVESVRTHRLVSVSAYTPLLPGGMKTRGGYMNVQVATRVNQNTNRRIITMGTPIITIEY